MEAVVFFVLLYLAYRMTHWTTVAEAVPAAAPPAETPPAPSAVTIPRAARAARVAHANMRPMRKTRRDVDPCVDCTTGDCDGCEHNPD